MVCRVYLLGVIFRLFHCFHPARGMTHGLREAKAPTALLLQPCLVAWKTLDFPKDSPWTTFPVTILLALHYLSAASQGGGVETREG